MDMGGTKETIRLINPVKCEGEIEVWLRKLEKSMQKTIREKCRKCNEELGSVKRFRDGNGGRDIKEWINSQES